MLFVHSFCLYSSFFCILFTLIVHFFLFMFLITIFCLRFLFLLFVYSFCLYFLFLRFVYIVYSIFYCLYYWFVLFIWNFRFCYWFRFSLPIKKLLRNIQYKNSKKKLIFEKRWNAKNNKIKIDVDKNSCIQ